MPACVEREMRLEEKGHYADEHAPGVARSCLSCGACNVSWLDEAGNEEQEVCRREEGLGMMYVLMGFKCL